MKDDCPIAIIGVGLRLPPKAQSLEEFWRFLLRGGDAVRPVPQDRWDLRRFWDSDKARPGKTYIAAGGFLTGKRDLFDPLAFGISPREAEGMDPQQRMLLEVAWEAFEDAGLPLEAVAGSRTGVFVGGFCLDHLIHIMQPGNRRLANPHTPTSATMTLLANRLSYQFDLKGPSLTLDTACSSSLVAFHLACRSLIDGECETAITGGVNAMNRPEFPIMMSKGKFLSDTGRSRAFDEAASGYARGEGAGVFLLKPLNKAIEDGDEIHAVVRGTATNQDGHTTGISLPSESAQAELMRSLYQRAGVDPAQVDYIEAHGTGTQAGDPAEAAALDSVFSGGGRRERKLRVGSVKTNIGHLEAAAGFAGVLKALLVLRHRQVPPNLHFKTPNPKIPFADYCLEVPREAVDLPPIEEKELLFAGVNSFGYGGSNAHAILESAPVIERESTRDEPGVCRLIPLSAKSEPALLELAGKMAFVLGTNGARTLADIAYTAAYRRSHHDFRCVALADSVASLRGSMISASTAEPSEDLVTSTAPAQDDPRLVFVFTGMGPQWWGMGQELMRTEAIVAEAVREVDAHFAPLAGWSLWDAMNTDEDSSRMAYTDIAQPANFALQVGLLRLWESWGITPAAVVGHSVGEVASSYCAGVYSMADAVRISYHRSHLQKSLAGRGGMLAVGAPRAEVEAAMGDLPDVSIAAVNSPSSVTVSGDQAQLDTLAERMAQKEIFNKALRVEVAYHSPQMEPIREALLEALADIKPREPGLPLYSTAYGGEIPPEKWDAEYWWHNVREPVLFSPAIEKILEDGHSLFLEVGPHPVLGHSIKETAAAKGHRIDTLPSLRRMEPECRRMLTSLAELYVRGCEPDWTARAPRDGQFIRLPKYPWQKQSYWLESRESKMDRLGEPGPVYLHQRVPATTPTWEVEINRNFFPFLFDHKIQDRTVFAGAAYIEAALALHQKLNGDGPCRLKELDFENVLVIDYRQIQHLATSWNPESRRFGIHSREESDEGAQQRHVSGRLVPLPREGFEAPPVSLDKYAKLCTRNIPVPEFYKSLHRRGLIYGEWFQPVTEVKVGEREFIVKMEGKADTDPDEPLLHPTLLDAAFQTVLSLAEGTQLFVPHAIQQLTYFGPPPLECVACGRLLRQTDTFLEAEIWLTDESGRTFAHIDRISCQAIELPADESKVAYYDSGWEQEDLPESDFAPPPLLILADEANSDMALAEALAKAAPGSVLVSESIEGRDADDYRELLDKPEHADFGHFVILWGSAAGNAADYALFERLSGAVVEFARGMQKGSCQRADITFVTRQAQLVTDGDEITNLGQAPFSSLALLLQNELDSLTARTVDLPGTADPDGAAAVARDIAAQSLGDTAFREGRRHIRALKQWKPEKREKGDSEPVSVDEPVTLGSGAGSGIEGLSYRRAERRAPDAEEIEVRVAAAALNYKDLLKLYGRIHPLALRDTFFGEALGMEVSGTVLRVGSNVEKLAEGDRIMALAPSVFASHCTIPAAFALKTPKGMSAEAAAIPVAYLTAAHCLRNLARIREGERVLIHNGSGGLGQAAIDVARWTGAEIFTTAGSEEKRAMLRDMGVEHVFHSRDLSFADGVMKATGGKGVDVVISALTDYAQQESLGLLRSGGRFIEVGKKDILEDKGLPLRVFNKNLVFASVDIDRLLLEDPALMRETLEFVRERFDAGDFKLGPTQSFSAAETADAFNLMAQSRHIGKILVSYQEGTVEVEDETDEGPAISATGAYIVTGGTSGFGLETAQWLASKGAGRVILASRSGGASSDTEPALAAMRENGAEVAIEKADVTSADDWARLVNTAEAGKHSLKGVVHAAMVLDDVLLADMSPERFSRTFRPKVDGALKIADAVRGKQLDFVLFYSSVSALMGNRGQANYDAANAFLDAHAKHLRSKGIPAISINWGSLAETGAVARDERVSAALDATGLKPLSNDQAFAGLELALQSQPAQVGIFMFDWAKWQAASPGLAANPIFKKVVAEVGGGSESQALAELKESMAGKQKAERLKHFEEEIVEVFSSVLRLPPKDVDPKRKLNEMGVDSLLILELSLALKERIGVTLSAMEFLKSRTLSQLAILADEKVFST